MAMRAMRCRAPESETVSVSSVSPVVVHPAKKKTFRMMGAYLASSFGFKKGSSSVEAFTYVFREKGMQDGHFDNENASTEGQ